MSLVATTAAQPSHDQSWQPFLERSVVDRHSCGGQGERDKQVLVTFLRARGLEPTAQQMARIDASQDAEEIRRWLARALDASSVAAVLDG